MPLSEYTFTQLSVLMVLLIAVIITDTFKHKIPNVIVLLIVFSGVSVQCFTNGGKGGLAAILGMTIGLCLLLPMYILGGMRAGDVKLMSAIGSYMGLSTFMAVGLTLIMGGFTAILILLFHGDLVKFIRRYYQMIKELFLFKSMSYIPAEKTDSARLHFPYAAAIASGTMLTIFMFPDLNR